MADDLLTTIMEVFTLVVILASAVVFARLAIKSKSVGNFRFQLSLFILVWAFAEATYVSGDLGIVAIGNYDTIGLAFHFISMAAFAIFVGGSVLQVPTGQTRLASTAREASSSHWSHGKVSASSFDDLVENSVTETLSKILGGIVWKSIMFYFEPRALSRDPDALPEVLESLFGNHARVLERVIADDLLTKVGVPEESRRGYDFRGLVRMAKTRFISAASTLTRTSTTGL